MKKIGIIFPMVEELDAIRKYLTINSEKNIYELKFIEGKINNVECILVQSGVGKVNAARTTQLLIDNYKVDYIFNVGVAGGIDESLNVLDIVIGDRLVQHDFDITAFDHEKGYIPNTGVYIEADKNLANLATRVIKSTESCQVRLGTIASGDIFCTDPKMTKKINSKFNALCVEMESASIAQVCYLCKVPFLIMRSISDVPNNNNAITYVEFLDESSEIIANALNNILGEID